MAPLRSLLSMSPCLMGLSVEANRANRCVDHCHTPGLLMPRKRREVHFGPLGSRHSANAASAPHIPILNPVASPSRRGIGAVLECHSLYCPAPGAVWQSSRVFDEDCPGQHQVAIQTIRSFSSSRKTRTLGRSSTNGHSGLAYRCTASHWVARA